MAKATSPCSAPVPTAPPPGSSAPTPAATTPSSAPTPASCPRTPTPKATSTTPASAPPPNRASSPRRPRRQLRRRLLLPARPAPNDPPSPPPPRPRQRPRRTRQDDLPQGQGPQGRQVRRQRSITRQSTSEPPTQPEGRTMTSIKTLRVPHLSSIFGNRKRAAWAEDAQDSAGQGRREGSVLRTRPTEDAEMRRPGRTPVLRFSPITTSGCLLAARPAASPQWTISAVSTPTNLSPTAKPGEDRFLVSLSNTAPPYLADSPVTNTDVRRPAKPGDDHRRPARRPHPRPRRRQGRKHPRPYHLPRPAPRRRLQLRLGPAPTPASSSPTRPSSSASPSTSPPLRGKP